MSLHNQTEEDLHKVLQQSLLEPKVQAKELSVDQTMEILLRNYSEKDPNALKKLCVEYEGRGADLEKYLETNFKDIPTRDEVEQEQQEMRRLSNEAKRIRITVVHQKLKFPGNFKFVKYTLTFRKWLMKNKGSFSKRAGQKSGSSGLFEFSYKGKRIQEDDTPLSLEMEDESVIEAETVVEVTKVFPKREFDEDDPLTDGFRKAEAQFLKMQADGFHMNLCIESVDIVKNKFLQEQFDEKRKELNKTEPNVKSLLLFHGTPQQNIMSILRHNFDLSKRVNGRKYGDGVYFSEKPEASIDFTFGVCF